MKGPFLAALAALVLVTATPARRSAVLGLDHVVVAVRDLDAAAARYRQLGFTLKPGRPHANGIRNQHVKFADGTELELLTVPPTPPPDATVRRYQARLAEGDGPVFVALYAPDPELLSRRLGALGQPHARDGRYVSIRRGDRLDYVFFGPRNASPTDRPEHFVHANGADALIGVSLAGDTGAVEALLVGMGARLEETRPGAPRDGERLVRLHEGFVRLLPAPGRVLASRPIASVTLRTRNLDALRHTLSAEGLPPPPLEDLPGGRQRLVLGPALTHGVGLEFLAEP